MKGLDSYTVIVAPVLTEKSVNMARESSKYTFRVAPTANKIQIAKAIEEIFNVDVTQVNTLKIRGKERKQNFKSQGKTPDWKKAIVKLKPGQTIDLFEGL